MCKIIEEILNLTFGCHMHTHIFTIRPPTNNMIDGQTQIKSCRSLLDS